MADIVNSYFRKFYPTPAALAAVEPTWCYVGFGRAIEGVSNIFPEMVCVDGLRLSVQGHAGAYSHPRDDWADAYLTVEIMGPKKADDLLSPYERDCNSVGDEMIYPYVPVIVVEQVIARHGGLVEAAP